MTEALTNLDKSTWVKHRFDEIAMMVSERVDPNNTDLEIYVGLEHLDSESLHIRSHGTPDDVNGTKLRFYKGDVIFGRRRAYQRKAAIAEYDGFCSAHAMVLRAKPDVIDPALFPFFLHSDQFMHRAVDISVGSLSPTINWKTLRKQEFLLPPKAEQARLAELLWAGDGVLEGLERVSAQLRQLLLAAIKTYVFSEKGWQKNNFIRLKDCLIESPSYGANASAIPSISGKPRYIRITDIGDDGKLIGDNAMSIEGNNYDAYELRPGDFLIARTGNTVGKSLLFTNEMPYSVYAGYLIRFRLNPEIMKPKTLYYICKSNFYAQFITSKIKLGAQPNINSKEYQSMRLPVISEQDQTEIIRKLDSLEYKVDLAKRKVTSTHALQKSLINQIF